jgi:hypothetical protein
MLLSLRNSGHAVLQSRSPLRLTESHRRRRGTNSHTGGPRPSICVRQPWVSETKSMVPLKPTRAASHRDARRTPGRSALQRRCDLEAAAKGQRTKGKDGGNHERPIRGPIGGGRLSVHIHGPASGAAGVCRIRPTTSPAVRAAVLLNYVLRPADFIGHCNVRLSLSAGDEFRTSKKHRLQLQAFERGLPLWFMF